MGTAAGWLVLITLGCSACAARAPSAPSATRPHADSIAALEAAYRTHSDSARRRFTAADVQFMTGMIGHHAQALVMAALIEGRTTSGAIRTLGGRIINAQRDEIALMQQWLRERDQPVPHVQISGTTLTIHGAEHAAHMPGMLTPEQMQQLERANGTAFDRLFLTLMIQHHNGAVTMVDVLVASPGSAQEETVFKVASGIRVDQVTEIDRMRLMLQALP